MLLIFLFLSWLLLVVANIAYRRSSEPNTWVFLAGAGLAVVPVLLGCVLPTLTLHAVLLVVTVAWCRVRQWRPVSFTAASIAVTAAAYGIVGGYVYYELHALQQRYPYVSLEERLHEPRVRALDPLPEATSDRLLELESGVQQWRGFSAAERPRRLQQLHERTVALFINQPGFGQARMSGVSEQTFAHALRHEPPPSQPGARIPFVWSSGDLEQSAPALRKDELTQGWDIHSAGVVDFLNPKGFGYFKDRRHVAGFQAHRFSDTPVAEKPWVLRTLDLVGLVVHETPVVYVSDHLPSMEELRDAPRRPPDEFESLGLRSLISGEDLYVRDAREGRWMLGAIRNAQQCLQCHGGGRGDLLGAFSYTFTRAP